MLTHTLHYGMGVFEGVRAYKTPEARRSSGSGAYRIGCSIHHIIRMAMPYDMENPDRGAAGRVRANELKSCYLRPIVFYGSEKMGVRHAEHASTWRSPPGRGAPTSARKALPRASG